MASPDNDKLAREVMQAHASFEERLHGKGRFPRELFQAFFDAVVRYVTATADEPMIHRNVAGVVTSLREVLELKSLRAPGKAIADADRLHCMLFAGYDPHFEGDEPPGL
jgi:hypothetical protein